MHTQVYINVGFPLVHAFPENVSYKIQGFPGFCTENFGIVCSSALDSSERPNVWQIVYTDVHKRKVPDSQEINLEINFLYQINFKEE